MTSRFRGMRSENLWHYFFSNNIRKNNMPPKRNIKLNKTKPPAIQIITNDSTDSLEAELKFDQEVIWCISQFEKLINSEKINDAKKNESMRAIMTLKRQNVSKIEKIQLMKSYFKDYKSKMAKEQETIINSVSFDNDQECTSNGKCLKKKVQKSHQDQPASNAFLFNFNAENLNDSLNKMKIS